MADFPTVSYALHAAASGAQAIGLGELASGSVGTPKQRSSSDRGEWPKVAQSGLLLCIPPRAFQWHSRHLWLLVCFRTIDHVGCRRCRAFLQCQARGTRAACDSGAAAFPKTRPSSRRSYLLRVMRPKATGAETACFPLCELHGARRSDCYSARSVICNPHVWSGIYCVSCKQIQPD